MLPPPSGFGADSHPRRPISVLIHHKVDTWRERRAETKRHLAALQLQTMYHHHRAEKARAKTLLLEKRKAARSRPEDVAEADAARPSTSARRSATRS